MNRRRRKKLLKQCVRRMTEAIFMGLQVQPMTIEDMRAYLTAHLHAMLPPVPPRRKIQVTQDRDDPRLIHITVFGTNVEPNQVPEHLAACKETNS